MQYRQGDVMVERVDAVPAGAKKIKTKGEVILAEGEVTGHFHRVKHPEIQEFEIGGMRFFTIPDEACVTHDEHDTITLPPGTYRVQRQREYRPEAIRNVAD